MELICKSETSLASIKEISPARLAAFEILQRVEDGAFASILLASRQNELKPADRTLAHELVLGVLRRQLFLDGLITHFSNRAAGRLDPPVQIALRLGLYQLRFLTRIPPSAAVNESVKLVRFARVRSAEGLVNAVLRRATREPEFDPTLEIEDPIERLAVETSHPIWLLNKWIKDFGEEFTREFAIANNSPPIMSFRVVKNRADECDLIQKLRGVGKISKSIIASGGWRFEGPSRELIELAKRGEVYLQDEASQLVAELCVGTEGDRFLDLCAAPGSKSTLVADSSAAQTLVAADISQPRLRTVTQTAQLQGLDRIRYVVLNGLEPLPFHNGTFDTILVDAPCSGSGTLRRNPEIRWRITAADIKDLSDRQIKLLENAVTILKPSGTIVYSTCSVEPEENELVVDSFRRANRGFQQIAISTVSSLKSDGNAIRTWPQRDNCDGFYVTALRREAIEN
jgi:16S rRNA (cytosine967-C5)-methyltransferase